MAKKRIASLTILSLFLVTLCFSTSALASPRSQLSRDYVTVQTTSTREYPQPSPTPAPSPLPSPAPGGSGVTESESDGGGNTITTTRTGRSGGFSVAPPVSPAPAPQPAPPLSAAPAAPSWMTANEAYAFRLLNETRIKNGIPPIKAHRGVTEQARLKARDMVQNNYFSHTSPAYGSAANMLRNAGIPYRAVGENLSMAGNVYQAHLQLEYSSKGHRQIMLNANYNYVGIGVVPLTRTPGINMVQIFIRQ